MSNVELKDAESQSPSSRALRVAILGAGGTIAPAIIRDLAGSDEVSSLKLLDLDLEKAKQSAELWGGGKAEAIRADALSDLPVQLRDCDILVNSASYRINLEAMQACHVAGCHYLDLGGLYWVTDKQLELDQEFRDSGLIAVLGIGAAPGKTNVMALRAVRELDVVDSVTVSAAARDLNPPPGLNPPYSLQTIIDELTLPPIVLHDGRAAELAPMASGGDVGFPDPVGLASTIYTLHSELRTFGDSFGCAEASFRLSLSDELLERVKQLIDATPAEIAEAAASAGRPSADTVAVHLVEASGAGRHVRVSCVTKPMTEWKLGGGVVSTAAPAAATVRLIAAGKINRPGVHPPEACIDPDDLFAELERRGSKFEVEIDEG